MRDPEVRDPGEDGALDGGELCHRAAREPADHAELGARGRAPKARRKAPADGRRPRRVVDGGNDVIVVADVDAASDVFSVVDVDADAIAGKSLSPEVRRCRRRR